MKPLTRPVVHWFDFICPFCYIAQDRNRILRESGVSIVELPMQIHPEIGPGGAAAPPRQGPMYDHLAREARAAGLELNWSDRIPYSRPALAAAETLRTSRSGSHEAFIAAVFNAYFGLVQDIEDPAVITRCAEDVGIDTAGVIPESIEEALRYSERKAAEHHVSATPSWLVENDLVTGLQPRELFVALGRQISS